MKTPELRDIRTRRIKITQQELSIGQSIVLATIPSEENERSLSAFLRYTTQAVVGVDNVSQWTVQERLLALSQYISASSEIPDFELTKNGHYSDYLAADNDVEIDDQGELKTIPIGEIGGDRWRMRYLTGGMAESIERLQGEVKYPDGSELSGYAHWELGCMAAMLFIEGSEPPDLSNEGLFDEQQVHRMKVFLSYPQSTYDLLRNQFYTGWDQLNHLFNIGLSESGLVILPREVGSALPPARFRVSVILSATAKNLAGQYD